MGEKQKGEKTMPTKEELKMLQALPLEIKVLKTKQRIREWVERFGEDGVYVSFSGGKDSTVLLHIVRSMYPNVEAVFVDTGLEYPEIRQFVKTFDNVTILRPKMRFDEVIKKYGYPLIGKKQAETIALARKNIADWKYSLRLRALGITPREAEKLGMLLPNAKMLDRYEKCVEGSKFNIPKYRPLLRVDFLISDLCCNVIKKKPAFEYQNKTGKKTILATMAVESAIRKNAWLKNGCNAFTATHPSSTPMSFWTEQDVLHYIKENELPIASVYGDIVYRDNEGHEYKQSMIGGKLYTTGCDRTGCIFCAFGCHLEKEPSRFQRLKETHPKQYEYCIGGGEYDDDGIWKPNKEGLGMGHVFDELNKIYGEGFIKYK